jgi:AraC-like DNA-binding protein
MYLFTMNELSMKEKLPAQIKLLIDQDPSRDHSLEQLARQLHVSKTKLMQRFKAAYGTSIHQYVLKQRLRRASILLKQTDSKISVIARDSGFTSEKHFMMLFKKFYKRTAGAYRAAYRDGRKLYE